MVSLEPSSDFLDRNFVESFELLDFFRAVEDLL